jgi:hypothetical protein
MCFFVDHLAAFTPEFVRLLQHEVLSKFPLWRLLAQYSEKQIGVYPSGAWIGAQWVECPFDAAHPSYRAWLRDAQEYHEKRFGPLRRQLNYLCGKILNAREIVNQRGVAVLAVFDCFDPLYHPEHAVWFLQARSPNELCLVSEYAPHRTSAVSASGEIYPQYCREFVPHTDVAPPFWLVTYLLPPANRHELAVADAEGKIVARFVVSDILSDASLKAAEAASVKV